MTVLRPAKIWCSSVGPYLRKLGYDFDPPPENERENVLNVLVWKLIVILLSCRREEAEST